MNQKNRLYAGASIALVAAAALGFGAARLTAPTPAAPKEDSKPAPADSVAMSAQAIEQSQIAVAPVMAGELDAAVMASATVEAMPDAQAVLTAHAPGTVTRIFKRIGDPVRAGKRCYWWKAAMPRRSPGIVPPPPPVWRWPGNRRRGRKRWWHRVCPPVPIMRPLRPIWPWRGPI
jgi:hypothetical protein